MIVALASVACAAARPGPATGANDGRRAPPSGAAELVRSLSDAAGPRLAGSPGDALAVAWATRTMRALGLANVHTEVVHAQHWERGPATGEVIAPAPRVVALAALGGSVGTPEGGLEADVVEVDSLAALERLAPQAVAGRIVFFNTPTERRRDGSGYGAAVPVRVRGPARAARLGAVGVLVRSIGTDAYRLPHTGWMRYEDGVARVPAAALAIPDAEYLHRLIAQGVAVRFRLAMVTRQLPEAETANVVGDVPGATHPEQIVLLGAHLDSWDLGTGAIDDGAGCAIVLSAAHQLAARAARPVRTLRVVLFANEENGGAGASAYATAHAAELVRHVVAIEADTGDGRVFGLRYGGAPAFRGEFARVVAGISPLGVELQDGPARGGADVAPLMAAGVPALDLRQDMSSYFDFHHTANDTPAIVRPDELDRAVEVYAWMADALTAMPGDLGRAPPAEHER